MKTGGAINTSIWKPRTTVSLVASIAIHVVAVVLLGLIVFKYPIGQLMGIREPEAITEHVQFVRVPPQPTETSVGNPKTAPARAGRPAPLQAPVATPAPASVPATVDSAPARAAGGTGTGFGVSGSPFATGVEPRQPDRRIPLESGDIERTPRTVAQDVDSIVGLVIGIVNDSIAIANGQRKPGDWTWKGKDGQTWGWDQRGIHVGKYTIPQALLALLPLNVAGGGSPIEARSTAYIRRDVLEHAQQSISEDEFKAAIKRIRERKEREKRQKMLVEGKEPDPAP
ncbi:MAG TPA: hypothetical protein VJ867_00360 [Gemmatimonadaceae bacterium]|nr:hypothetical protein [Gemmatimonadaceae bacterium]